MRPSHLAARGDVDAERMAIRGGSAGGMTALNALAAGEGFAACVVLVRGDRPLGLVATTHDFEAHYTDRLIGPLPEAAPALRGALAREPRRRHDGVGPAAAGDRGRRGAPGPGERMRDALEAAGRRCDLRFFEGEGHGFRRADTLTACLEAELAFYLRGAPAL